jgi:hypothetical protein
MVPFTETRQKINCPDCGKEMYRLPGSSEPIFVCPKCGNSIDAVCEQDNPFSSEGKKIDEKGQLMKRLFPDYFMKKFTDFETFFDFISNCRFIDVDLDDISQETFEKLPKGRWDRYIQKNTCFSSWDEMFECAVERYLKI